jgi:hypothetical protein
VMAEKVWDHLNEGKPRPAGDCVPLWQQIILRNRKTGRYETREVGDLDGNYTAFDALSYNFDSNSWQFNPIIAWYDKGVLPVYLVRLTDGRELFCTENHQLIRYWRRGQGLGKGNPKGLTVGALTLAETMLEMSKNSKQPQVVTAQQIPALDKVGLGKDKAWLYGIYLAEGYGQQGRHQVDIAQSKMAVRAKIEQVLGDLGVPFKFYDRGRISGGQYYRLYGEIAAELRTLGLSSFDKRLPPEVFSANVEEAGAILDGLMAGDAWMPKASDWRNKYLKCVYATSSDGIKQTVDFLAMLTGRLMSRWLQQHHMGAGSKPIWRITERKILTCADSKKPHYETILPGLANGYIASVELIGQERCCDITVSDTHNFVTADGIVVHQCDDKTTFLAAMLLNRRFPVRIIAAWQSAVSKNKTVNHVYPEVKINGQWLPLEPSSKSLPFGKQSEDVKRIKIFWLSTENGDNVIQ